MEHGKEGVDEADFLVGYEGEGCWDYQGRRCELVEDFGGEERKSVASSPRGSGGKGLIEANDAEGEKGREEKGQALGQVVVPGIAAVKY